MSRGRVGELLWTCATILLLLSILYGVTGYWL